MGYRQFGVLFYAIHGARMTASSNPMRFGRFDSYDPTLIGSPGPMLILGPPGSGKGTQSAEIALRWDIPRISTGDLLRINVGQDTRLGRAADGYIRRGQLVPDGLIGDMVLERLENSDTLSGFILDGFPRTVRQAIWLDDLLSGQSQILPPIILSIHVNIDCLISRITRRMICRLCGAIYHEEFRTPFSAGICDRDGTLLEQRVDDTLDVFRARLDVYEAQTEPIIERYRNSNRFFTVDGDRPIHHVTETIIETIRCSRLQVE